jgi:hypothetical protein
MQISRVSRFKGNAKRYQTTLGMIGYGGRTLQWEEEAKEKVARDPCRVGSLGSGLAVSSLGLFPAISYFLDWNRIRRLP